MSEIDNTPDISDVIGKIMQNPQLSGMLRDMRGEKGGGGDTTDDIMSKLPQIMSVLSPMINGQGKSDDGEKADVSMVDAPEIKSSERYDKARALRLMSALKPYLSRERCSMIDKCMSVLQLGDIMTVLRGLEGFGKTES